MPLNPVNILTIDLEPVIQGFWNPGDPTPAELGLECLGELEIRIGSLTKGLRNLFIVIRAATLQNTNNDPRITAEIEKVLGIFWEFVGRKHSEIRSASSYAIRSGFMVAIVHASEPAVLS